MPAKWSGNTDAVAAAAIPARAPVIARVHGYTTSLRYGGRRSPKSDAAPTMNAANPPSVTAAKITGTNAIELSVVRLKRTRPRSESAATALRARVAHTSAPGRDATPRMTPKATAAVATAAT